MQLALRGAGSQSAMLCSCLLPKPVGRELLLLADKRPRRLGGPFGNIDDQVRLDTMIARRFINTINSDQNCWSGSNSGRPMRWTS